MTLLLELGLFFLIIGGGAFTFSAAYLIYRFAESELSDEVD